MLSQLHDVKLGSRGVWSRVLAGAISLLALGGCIIVDDNDSTYVDPGPGPDPIDTTPMLVNIETNMSLESTPGDGVGVFVEYYEGGTYRIWTTCDTKFSGTTCPFDIYTSVDTASNIFSITHDNLEGYDNVTVNEGAGTVDISLDTSSDYDAVEIDVTPGAILRVEAYVDGVAQPRFVYWFGDGVLHQGAPTSPVDFLPSKP